MIQQANIRDLQIRTQEQNRQNCKISLRMNFPHFFSTQQTEKFLIAPPSLSERRNQQLLVNTRPNFEQKNSEKSNKQAQSQRASEISSIAGNTRRESDSGQTMFQSLHEQTPSYRELQTKYNTLDRNYKILVARYRQLEEDLEIEKQAKELYMHENEQLVSHFTENGVDMADIEMSINILKQAKDQYQNQKSLLLKQQALSKKLISILEECLERLEDGISYRKMLTEGRYIKDEMDEDTEMVNKIRDFLHYISKERQDSSRVKLPFGKYSQQDQIMEVEEEKVQVFSVDGYQINIQSLKLPELKQNGTINETERQYDQSQSIQIKDESQEKSHERDLIIRQNLTEESLHSQNQLLINNKYISELLERISEQSKEGMSEGSGQHEIGQILNRTRSRKKGGSEIKRMASEQFGNVDLNDSKISEPIASQPFVGQHDEFHDNNNHTPEQLYQTLRAIEQKFTQLERSSARELSQNKQERLVLTQQIGQLEEIIIRLREQILEMESEIKQNHWNQIRLEEEIKKKNMNLIEAHDKFKEQLRTIDQLKQEIHLEKDVIKEAQKELDDKEMVIEEMTKQVSKLQDQVRNLRNSSVLISNQTTKQLRIWEKSLEEKAKLIEEKKMTILVQSQEITRLKKENFDCSNRIKELTKYMEQVQSKSKQGLKKLEKQKQGQISILKERLSISERSKEILSTEIVNLKKELIQKNTSFQKLSEQYTSSLDQLSQQNAPASLETAESIATEVSRISQLNQELKQTNHELAEKLIKMQNIKIKLEEQNCSLRKESQHQQMINAQVSEEVEKERHANEAFFQQNRRLQAELKSLSSDVEKERVSKKSLSIQIQSLQGSVTLLQSENKRMKERNQSLLAQIKKMASSNESSTESEYNIKGSLLSEIDSLKSDVSKLESETSQIKKLNGELIVEMETLKDINNSLEGEIQKCKIREENDFEQMQRLKLQKGFLADDLKTLRLNNAESAKVNNQLKQSKKALLRQIESIQSKLNEALAQNYSIKIRNGQFAETIANQEQSIIKLSEQELAFKTQNMQLKEQVAQLITLNGKLSNQLQSLQENTVLSNHEKETVVQKLETMRKEKDILEMEREEWRAECEKLKQMIGNMENLKQQICPQEDLINGQRSMSNDSFQSIEMSQTPSKDKSMNEEFEFRDIQTMSKDQAATSKKNRQYEEMIAEKDQIISKYEQNISMLQQQLIGAECKLNESFLIKNKIQQELEKTTFNHNLLITELQKEKSKLLELQLKDKSFIKIEPFKSVGRQRQTEPNPFERPSTEEELQFLKSEHQTAVNSSKIDCLFRQNASLRNQLSQQREEKDKEIGTLQQIINQKIQEFGNKLVQQENNFQVQIENYQQEIDSLQQTIAQYESQTAILTSQISRLNQLIQNYENQKSSLSEQLSSVREQNSQIQIQTKIKEERGKMEKLTQIQTLTTEIDSLKRHYNQSLAKLKAVEFSFQKKTEQNAKLLQKISKYEDQLNHLSEKLSLFSSQINEKEIETEHIHAQLDDKNAKFNQIECKHKQELSELVSTYEEKLSLLSHKAKQQIEDRETVLSQIRTNYEEQFNLINSSYSKSQAQKEQEVQFLHQEIHRLRQNIQTLQLKLSDLQLNQVNMTFSTSGNTQLQGQVPYFSSMSRQKYPKQSDEVGLSNEFTSLKLAYQSLQRLHSASENAHNCAIQDLKQSHFKELSRINNEHEEKVAYIKNLNKKAKQRLIEQQKKLKSQEYNLQEFVQLLNEKDKVLQQIVLKANQKDTAYQQLMADTTSKDQLLRQLSQHLHEKQSNLTEVTRSLKQKSQGFDQLLKTKQRLDELQQYVNSFTKVEFELSQKNELLQKQLTLNKENYEHQLEELFSRCQNYQKQNEYLKREYQNLYQKIQKQAGFNQEKMRFIFHESKKEKLRIHTLTHSYKFAGQATKTPAVPSSIKTSSHDSSQTYLKQKKSEELQTNPMRLSTEVEYEKVSLVKSTQSVFIKSQQPIQTYTKSHEIDYDMPKSINDYNQKPKSIPNPLLQLSETQSSFQPILMNAPNAQRQRPMKFKVPSLKVDPLPSYSKNEFTLMKSNDIPFIFKTGSQVMRNTNNLNDRVVKESLQQKQPFSYRPKPQRDSNAYSQSNDFFMIQNRKVPTEKQSDANPFNNVFESRCSKQQTSLNSFLPSSSKGQRPGTDFPKISEIPSPTHSLSSLPDFTSKIFLKNKSIAVESGKQVHQGADTSSNTKIDSKKMFEMKMLEETIRRKREENEQLQKMIKDKKCRNF